MAELNITGAAGADDSNGPLSSREGRTRRNASDTDSLLGRDGVREVKATVKELAGVLKELARVQKQELKNEQTRLTNEKRQQDRQQRQQATLQERQQRQDQRRLERDQRRFDRDYDAAYQQEDRRNYQSLRYNADFENRLLDQKNAAEAAAAKADERPDFGRGHRALLGSAGYNTAQRFGMGEGSSRSAGHLAARTAGYVADTFGVGGLLEAGVGMGAFDALAAAGGPAVEIPALIGTTGLAGAIAAFQAQGAVTNLAGRFVGSAQPFTDLIKFAANSGRAGNYNGDSLVSALFGDTDKRDRALNQYGIGPNEVSQIMSAYGDRGTSASDILQIAQSVGQANQSNYLGGLGLSQTASLLGFGKTMFGTSGSAQTSDYFSKWQSVFEQAVALGLDRSQVATTLENMVTQRADSGSANTSLPDAANLFGKFAQSGLAGGRDGSLAQSYSQSLTNSWQNAGFGGDLYKTEAAEMLFQRGGSHQTMAQFGKLFGFDPNKLVGSAYTMAKQALAAGNKGDWASFGSAAPPLMSQSAQQQADQLLAGSWFQPGTVPYTAALAAMEGTNYSTETGALGSTNLPNPVGLAPGKKPPSDVLAAIQKAAKDKGVNPDELLALLGNETTWGTNVHDSSTGAVGILQIEPKTFAALQKQGLVDKKWTLDQIRKDPLKNAEVAAAAWKQDLQLAGGNPQLAAAYYNGGMTLNDASRGYASQWQANYNMLTGANNLSDYNTIFTRDQQLNIASGFTAYKAAEALLTGKPGQSIESGSDVISSIAGSASDFVTGAKDFTSGVSDFRQVVAMLIKGIKNQGRGLTKPSFPNGSPQPLAPVPATPYVGHHIGGR
jgi:hypothetical protein